jgi:TonB-linked SusC/RagA family outer membrane protein
MKSLALLTFLCVSHLCLAQFSVSGKVVDETGEPIPGANILIEGTATGTATDIEGQFSLEVPEEGTVLVVSFIGYEQQELVVNRSSSPLTVTLAPDYEELEEVVVVGYGTVRKSDVTGAVSSVETEDRVARQYNTVDQLIQGRAAGVQVTGSGQPGSGVSVRIRGTNSLRGNNEPLYVVDGIIISSAGEDAANASTDGNTIQSNQNGLNGINPRDIESIEILKDASATAIYGSRGANGVVLITTRKGEEGRGKIDAYVTTSITNISRKLDVLDAIEYARYRNEGSLVNGQVVNYQVSGDEVYPIDYVDNMPVVSLDPMEQVNWQDELFEQANDINAGVTFSGGTSNGSYYVSAGYNDQGGLVENARFQTGDIRFNINQKLNDKLEVQGRFNAFTARGSFAQDGDRAGGANRSFVNNLLLFDPFVQGDLEDYAADLGLSSPLSWINDFEDKSKETRVIGGLALIYDLPVEGLSYEINAGGNIRLKERRRWYGLTTFKGGSSNGTLALSELEATSFQFNNLLRYNNRIADDHRINAVVGFTVDRRQVLNELYEVEDFVTTSFTTDQPFFGQAVTSPLMVVDRPTNILSTLGRVTYTFRNKYILTATGRYDGVSKFKGSNRWSFFPSISFAWRAHAEPFIESLDVFDNLKIRAGWGQIGNHGIQPFQTLANYGGVLYGTPSNGTSVAFVPFNIPNEDLIWETTEQVNLGIDFGFLDNRLQGTIDVYHKKTKDLLQQLALPPSTGFGSLSANRGSIRNQGVEVTLSGIIFSNEKFSLELGGNIAVNRNEIIELGIPESAIYIDGVEQQRSFYFGDEVSTGLFFKSPANIFMQGESLGLFVGYETDGIYQSGDTDILEGKQPGDIRIIDQNGDGEITSADRTIIGDPNPDFIFGINLNSTFQRFSLNVQMSGVYGNDIANGNLVRLTQPDGGSVNILAEAYHGAWRPDRETNLYPRIGYDLENSASAVTDRIIEDGSFLRMSNITLSYDVPMETVRGVSSLSIYLAARNLFTLTNYSGYDPELNSFLYNGNILGVDWSGTPNTRSFTLGANISF